MNNENNEYNNYLLQMKRLKASLPYMSEKDFCEANGLKYGEDESPIFIARKSSSAKEVKPTLEAHIEIKPPKEKRPYQYATTEEERKLARTRYTKQKREDWKAAGLNAKGKPYKSPQASRDDFKNVDEFHDYHEAGRLAHKLGIKQ